jgi:hypothetical protein
MRQSMFAVFALTSLTLAACPLKQEVFDTVYGEWQYSCGSARTKGQKCSYDQECAVGLYCDSGTKTCSDRWVDEGGACAIGMSGCADDGFCKQGAMVGTCVAMTCSANGSCVAGAPLGRSCTQEDQDCGANAMCMLSTTSSGVCVAIGEVGDPCDSLTGACADGLMCDIWTTSKCVNPPAIGTRCENNEQCGPNRFCLTATMTLGDWEHPGTCQNDPKLPVGSACTGDVCGTGLHCDYSTNKCARNKAVGESCKNGNECGEDANIAIECVRQLCVATNVRGAKCWPGEKDRCSGDLTCVGPN